MPEARNGSNNHPKELAMLSRMNSAQQSAGSARQQASETARNASIGMLTISNIASTDRIHTIIRLTAVIIRIGIVLIVTGAIRMASLLAMQ